jgi:hypothetical protein
VQQALCHIAGQIVSAGYDFSSGTNVIEYKGFFPGASEAGKSAGGDSRHGAVDLSLGIAADSAAD